jgi:hypothetical protein
MLIRAFFLLTGFGLAVSGGISTIAYLNLLTTGNGVFDYLSFIGNRIECYLLPLGILIILACIYYPTGSKNVDG